MAEVVSRSKRVRKASSHVRILDAEARRLILQKKLDALESDNWHEDRRKEDADDDDYDPFADASSGDEVAVGTSKRPANKKNKAKRKRDSWLAPQQCKSLQEVLDEAQYHKYPSWVPNYLSVAAGPSRYPPRHFCSVTGVVGKYKCPLTGEYLGSLDAYTTHRETRLKGLI
uniref:Vps72/YL1 C-terminal domain-containing protein n=1 Tax=Strombidinopsis acuminata TaxID=141414 RepID=A0A7S3TUL0_9SPIT|mmetsp:Transcript_10762/g.33186  ORF Transcript_10762/g.33186 Transcript_10762/m.33186 type:complete len:171 (+) Transcript_10762:97-609(+)